MKNIKNILLLLILPLFLTTCSKNPVTGKRDFMLLSESQEKQMGVETDPQIVATMGIYNDEKLQDFINKKGKEMAAISHRPDLGYEFKIVDSPVINAFAVPGGYVYFTRGIMAHFNNEAEFAGVLGHEIGHITARHSAKQYSKSMIAQIGLGVGTVISERFRQFGQIAQTGTSLLFLKFGRDAERQSDRLGVEYSSEIGYDAHEMAGFFNTLGRLSDNSGQSIPNFLSTHPNPGDRYATVHRLASKRQSKKSGLYEIGRESYLNLIDGLVYGEDPRQGFVENGVFYHPELKFKFNVPQGWQLQNTPQQVQMGPEDGSAIIVFSISNRKDLNQAANDIVNTYQFNRQGSENTRFNGLPALRVRISQDGEQPTQGDLYLVSYASTTYYFISISTTQAYSSNSSVFKNTAGSFDTLTERQFLDRQPERIKIQRVGATRVLQSQLAHYGISDNRYEELAILNGMELTDRVKKGELIKLIK